MRFQVFVMFALLFLLSPIQAQEDEFPTLDALAELQIPEYDHADFTSRFEEVDISFSPPSSPPLYQVGDRESFFVSLTGPRESAPFELRGMTENVLIWVHEPVAFSRNEGQALAERVEEEVVGWFQQFLDYQQPPGIDGDPRLTVLMIQQRYASIAFFDQASVLPRGVQPISNERELLVLDFYGFDGTDRREYAIIGAIAQSYQELLLHMRDAHEELWLVKGLSTYVDHSFGAQLFTFGQFDEFFQAPNTRSNAFQISGRESPCCSAQTGAAGLFLIYVAEQYGDEIIARIHAESDDGWRSIDKVLREYAGVPADEVFADWVIANYYREGDGRFGYQDLPGDLSPAQPVATLRSFPALHSGSLPSYSSEYVAVDTRDAAAISLQFTQAPEGSLIDDSPYEGDHFYFAATAGRSNSRLTRAIDLTEVDNASIEFKIWHDLIQPWEYAHAAVSADGGESWDILKGSHSTDKDDNDNSVTDRYTGRSDGWLEESISLDDYTGHPILIRFETVNRSIVSTYRGMAIDDLRIDAINFQDGFEAPDDAWTAEGWLRSDNRLPNRTWLQVVQETDTGVEVSRSLMTGPGDMTVDLQPGVEGALIAISPIVPLTGFPTDYSLAVNLLDADGEAIVVDRDCKVTTTTGLNFRDAPNGSKIGLIPQGTAVWALDSSEGWFQVEYEDQRGWISGGYVTTEGSCA